MTVKELIEKLQQCPAELPVRYHYDLGDGGGNCCPVDFVNIANRKNEVFLSMDDGVETI